MLNQKCDRKKWVLLSTKKSTQSITNQLISRENRVLTSFRRGNNPLKSCRRIYFFFIEFFSKFIWIWQVSNYMLAISKIYFLNMRQPKHHTSKLNYRTRYKIFRFIEGYDHCDFLAFNCYEHGKFPRKVLDSSTSQPQTA